MYALLLAVPVTCTLIYTMSILLITWPVSAYSIESAARFGSSFGFLSALFSGLAFASLLVAVLMQQKDLALQRAEFQANREEFARTADSQERTARLAAIAELMSEYRIQIDKNDERRKGVALSESIANAIESEQNYLIRSKKKCINELEELLCVNGPASDA